MSRFDYGYRTAPLGRLTRVGLAKDPARAVVFGVCAGIARYLGVSPLAVRIVTLLSLLFSFGVTVLLYLLLALVMESVPSPATGWDALRQEMRAMRRSYYDRRP